MYHKHKRPPVIRLCWFKQILRGTKTQGWPQQSSFDHSTPISDHSQGKHSSLRPLENLLLVYSPLGSQELVEGSHWSSTTKFASVTGIIISPYVYRIGAVSFTILVSELDVVHT